MQPIETQIKGLERERQRLQTQLEGRRKTLAKTEKALTGSLTIHEQSKLEGLKAEQEKWIPLHEARLVEMSAELTRLRALEAVQS